MSKGRIVIAAALAASAAAVHAQEKLEVKLSGQVNRAVMFADDGHDSDSFFVDNDNSSTRLRFSGTGNLTPGLRAGAILEVEYQSSPSNLVTFADRDGASPRFDERHVDLFVEGGSIVGFPLALAALVVSFLGPKWLARRWREPPAR